MRKLVRSERFSLSRPDGRSYYRSRDPPPQSPSPVEPLLAPMQASPCLEGMDHSSEVGCNMSEIIQTSEISMPLSYMPPILKLPPEIRHSILQHLLPRHTKGFKVYTDCEPTISASRWNRTTSKPKRRQHSKDSKKENSLAILRTNRIFYYEALALLYSENVFHFIGSNYLPILDFFRRLSPEARDFVRQIRITMLPDGRELRQGHFDLFYRVMQDLMPGLHFLDYEPRITVPEVFRVLTSRI